MTSTLPTASATITLLFIEGQSDVYELNDATYHTTPVTNIGNNLSMVCTGLSFR